MTGPQKYLLHFPEARVVKTPRPGKCPLWGCRQQSRKKGILCARHSLRLWRPHNF